MKPRTKINVVVILSAITMASCSVDSIPFLGQSRPQPIPPPEPINCPEIPTVEEIQNTPVSGQVYGREFSLDKSDISLLYLRIQHGNLDPQAITVRFSFDIPVGSSYFDPVESSSPVEPIEYYTSKAEGTTYAYGGRYGTERESIWDYRVSATEYVKNLQEDADVDPYMLWDYSTSLDYPDYRVFLQIGQRQGDYLPGKLYLCIPEAATEIQGTFNAKLSPPKGTFVSD